MPSSRAVTRIDADEVLDPTPPAKAGRVGAIRLGTADEIRVEMAKVYREMRRGKLAPEHGTRLVFVLDRIAKVHELSVIEKQLKELEKDHGFTS